ncbi:MAG: putative metal-binding motif-containing protein [Myxococcota bacterium]
MLWLTAALAADWYIPADFPDLQTAVDDNAVQSGDVIWLGAVDLLGSVDVYTGKDLIVRGAGPGTTRLLASNGLYVAYVDGGSVLRLEDLTVDGEGTYLGVLVFNAEAELTRVQVENTADPLSILGSAPGLTVGDNAFVAVDQSVFLGNVGEFGGAIAVYPTAALSVTDTRLELNGASEGGAIRIEVGGDASIWGTTFVRNTAGQGGGLYAGGTVTITASTFDANAATSGGAVWFSDANGTLSIDDTRFDGNSATAGGGALAADSGSVVVRRSRLVANTAGVGGLAYGTGATWAFANVYGCGNSADDDAVLSMVAGTWSLENALFFGNGASAVPSLGLRASGTALNTTVWADAGSPMVDVSGGAFGASVVGTDVDVSQVGISVPSGGGNAGGNLLWNVSQVGPGTSVVADPGFQVDASSCDTAFYATATASIFDLDPNRSDPDGSPADLGHLGGPGIDLAFWEADRDLDGFLRNVDCDDDDASVHPGAPDACDGIDTDCDGTVEVPTTTWGDADGDGFGDPADPVTECSVSPGRVTNAEDCDDGDDARNPGAAELCNGIDDDCDLDVDDDDAEVLGTAWYADDDADGYGAMGSTPVLSCLAPSSHVDDDTDCDDTSSSIYPGAPEACPDGVDNDCDTLVDAADPDYSDQGIEYRLDADFDGVGDPNTSVVACSGAQPPGYVPSFLGADCNDADPQVAPGTPEVCDGVDNDCNGATDEGFVSSPYWPDLDLDGFGDASTTPTITCTAVPGYVNNGTDCDDGDDTIHPFATEICDGIDQSCSGVADDGLPTTMWYPDADGDGFGDASDPGTPDCAELSGHVEDATDCDDTDADVSPAAPEVPDDGLDNDCVGGDEITPVQDRDGDGIPDDIDPNPDSAGDGPGTGAPSPPFGCGCSDTGGAPTLPLFLIAGLLASVRRRV